MTRNRANERVVTRITRPVNARSSTRGIKVVENSQAKCFDVFYEKSPLCAMETHGYERAVIGEHSATANDALKTVETERCFD